MVTDYAVILAASALILLIFPAMLVWGWLKGQFRDIEEAKYIVLESEDDENAS